MDHAREVAEHNGGDGEESSAPGVFLSYSRRDTPDAVRLRGHLAQHGIGLFLDREHLTRGRPWQPELERAIADCRSTVVLVGPGGLGARQQREVQVALDLQTRDADRMVIPVLLGDADPPLGFLGQLTWVDLRDATGEASELDALVRTLRSAAPGMPSPARGAPLPICPYRGLQPFREEDARLFFGRDRAVDELMLKVADTR